MRLIVTRRIWGVEAVRFWKIRLINAKLAKIRSLSSSREVTARKRSRWSI